MIVTDIVPLSKSRSKIFLNQELAFVLYAGEIRKFHINQGKEISLDNYDIIMKEILPKRAKLRAMNLLKSRDYTTQQLRSKLEQGFFPEEIVEKALEYVASFHYTDDLRYAIGYITYHEESRSRRRIEMDLQKKGISKEIIEKAWLTFEENGGEHDEISQIERLLEKKRYNPEETDYKEQQKIVAFLMRKGFKIEQIRGCMKGFALLENE